MSKKVKLLVDVPFVEENGLSAGTIAETVDVPRLLKKPNEELWVKGKDGEDYRIFSHEWEDAPEEGA